MRSSLILDDDDGESSSQLCAAKLQLLYQLIRGTNNDEAVQVFQQYEECAPLWNVVAELLGRVSLKWNTTNEKNHEVIMNEDQICRTDLTLEEWFIISPLSADFGVVYVGRCFYGILLLSGSQLWPCRCIFVNRFDRDELPKKKIIKCYKPAVIEKHAQNCTSVVELLLCHKRFSYIWDKKNVSVNAPG